MTQNSLGFSRKAVDAANESAQRVVEGLDDLLSISAAAAEHLRSADFEERAAGLRSEVRQAAAGAIRVPVVGEFKSGKSSLINAVLGGQYVASHPLTATSVLTEIRYGDDIRIIAEVDGANGSDFVEVPHDRYLDVATQPSPAIGGQPVRSFRVNVPSPLLQSGLQLIDTPCLSGGISSPTAAAVIAELMQSHAWILTTDVSQEISGPELEMIRVGTSLCPVLLVAATRVDVSPHWREVLAVDQGHLDRLDPPFAVHVLPIASPLRSAAVRRSDPQLDRESGIPQFVWHLTHVTTSTVRLAATRAATESVIRALDMLDERLAGEIDALNSSGDRGVLLERSDAARQHCELLASSSKGAVDRAIVEFRKRTRRDLEDRIETVRRTTLDDLKQLEGERDWPKIEQQVQADVNRLLAEHLLAVDAEVNGVIRSVAEDLELNVDDLRIEDQLIRASTDDERISAQLDPPTIAKSYSSRMQAMIVPARVGLTGASGVGVGISTGILAGASAVVGIAMVPVAAVGAGIWLRNRVKTQETLPWKQLATNELNRFLSDCHQLISRCSEDVRDDILRQLPQLFDAALRRLAEQFAQDHQRLQALADDRGRMSTSEVEQRTETLSQLRLVATHARRLSHRLVVPRIEPPQNLTTMPATAADQPAG